MKFLIYIAFLFSGTAVAQYTTLQSQYMFNSIAMNPAVTGNENAMSLVGTFRAQWIGFSGAPTTEALTLHAPIKSQSSSVGIQLFSDQIGVDRNTGIYGLYSYKLRLKKGVFRMGVAGGLNFIRSNYSELDVANKDDALISANTQQGVLPNFSLGLHYSNDDYFISFSMPNFLSHTYEGAKFRISNQLNNYNFMLGGGYSFQLRNTIKLKPSLLLKYRMNNRPQIDFNVKAQLNPIFAVGISYRTEEALIGLFQLQATQQLAIMYSFGVPISTIIKSSFGSHELSLKYNFLYKSKIESPRFLGW